MSIQTRKRAQATRKVMNATFLVLAIGCIITIGHMDYEDASTFSQYQYDNPSECTHPDYCAKHKASVQGLLDATEYQRIICRYANEDPKIASAFRIAQRMGYSIDRFDEFVTHYGERFKRMWHEGDHDETSLGYKLSLIPIDHE